MDVGEDAICLTGAQDGLVQVWDANRVNKPIFKMPLHRGGAVNDIICPSSFDLHSGSLIATSGADKKMHLLDPRKIFIQFRQWSITRILYIQCRPAVIVC